MHGSKLLLILIAWWLSPAISIYAQTVTQVEFLDRLRQTHPLFEKENLTASIEQEEKNSLLGSQDWHVTSSINYLHEEPTLSFFGPEKTNAFSINGGLDRQLWKTGGRFSASFSSMHARLKLDPFLGFPDSYFENRLAVSYIHPLMRNRRGFLDRLQYDLKQFDIDISEVLAIENQEQFLAASAAKFLDWALLSEQMNIIRERLRLSEEELENTQEKRKAHLIDEVDVIRAEDAVRIARQNLLLTESQWKALQAELAVLTQDNNYYDLAPDYDLYRIEVLIPLDRSILELRESSRLIRALSIRLEQLGYARDGFMEIGKPDLSVIAQFNLKNAENGFGESFVMDKPDLLIGLQLGFPIENRTSKSKVTKTDIQIMQLEKQIDELFLELSSAVTNIHTQITELIEVLELNREQIESARRKTAEELNLYNQGRGDLTFVIQSRDSEQGAKLIYASNALTYQKLLLQYHALMDRLYQ